MTSGVQKRSKRIITSLASAYVAVARVLSTRAVNNNKGVIGGSTRRGAEEHQVDGREPEGPGATSHHRS